MARAVKQTQTYHMCKKYLMLGVLFLVIAFLRWYGFDWTAIFAILGVLVILKSLYMHQVEGL